ncbi:MAG: hypothetical protein HY713_02360 [candidate division NC10 bacterium]|nr:hypothetical protein [candidate division NC10 bacterium]
MGELVVYLGGFAGVAQQFPHTVLNVKGQNRVVLNRRPDGSLGLSLDVLGQDGRLITRIHNGEFVINQSNFLQMKRADRSSLRVVDQFGLEVLKIRYLNPQAVRIDAVLRYPGSQPIRFSGSEIGAGFCSRGNDADIVIN